MSKKKNKFIKRSKITNAIDLMNRSAKKIHLKDIPDECMDDIFNHATKHLNKFVPSTNLIVPAMLSGDFNKFDFIYYKASQKKNDKIKSYNVFNYGGKIKIRTSGYLIFKVSTEYRHVDLEKIVKDYNAFFVNKASRIFQSKEIKYVAIPLKVFYTTYLNPLVIDHDCTKKLPDLTKLLATSLVSDSHGVMVTDKNFNPITFVLMDGNTIYM